MGQTPLSGNARILTAPVAARTLLEMLAHLKIADIIYRHQKSNYLWEQRMYMYYDVVLWVGGWGGDNGIPGCEGWVLNITSKPCHWMLYTCACFKTQLCTVTRLGGLGNWILCQIEKIWYVHHWPKKLHFEGVCRRSVKSDPPPPPPPPAPSLLRDQIEVHFCASFLQSSIWMVLNAQTDIITSSGSYWIGLWMQVC